MSDLKAGSAALPHKCFKKPCLLAATCLSTALDLFTGCQPFLTDLTQNGGTLSKLTILQLLETALDKTADLSCLNATLNFVNQVHSARRLGASSHILGVLMLVLPTVLQGCICSEIVQTTLQALPTSTVPQLLKAGVPHSDSLLQRLPCSLADEPL